MFNKKIITLSAAALISLTLAGVAQTTSFAAQKQPQEMTETDVIHNPDKSLRKTLNVGKNENWSVATVDAGINGLSSLRDSFMYKEPTHILGQNGYRFEDGSDLYGVGKKSCDYIGVNEKNHKVTIATSANGARSTCFLQTINTKPGQKYHLSLNIEPNQVVRKQLGGATTTSEFSENSVLIACLNGDGSHLVDIIPRMMKKEGHTYSIDIPAKSAKTKFYVLLGTPHGLKGFYSAQISQLSLTENN